MTYPNPHTALYTSKQVYQIEKQWFEQGNDSFFLMQQASWQMACVIEKQFQVHNSIVSKKAVVWVGAGNNGGDGWLIGHYLLQFGWQVQVVEVAQASTKDSQQAKAIAIENGCMVQQFNEDFTCPTNYIYADVYIDALFGIGLDRLPTGDYQQAILAFNNSVACQQIMAVAVDIPSGLVASTGQVFQDKSQPIAIKADMTLCLIAYKLGLFLRDGREFAGKVQLLPLIPLPNKMANKQSLSIKPSVTRIYQLPPFPPRKANSHKGDFGHLLIIGGNQGMGGATILASQGAFAVGVGKLSVACHKDYHGALLANMPNAMSVDLHDMDSVSAMIEQVDMLAIGMGLGRDETAQALFVRYLEHGIQTSKDLLIDADGLYHLAHCSDELIEQLKNHAKTHFVAYTPHTGEMARLLGISNEEVENDGLSAIIQAKEKFAGNWLLKGAGSLIIENDDCYLCDAGNAGMASAGMGDVLSGVVAGLQAQRLTHPNHLQPRSNLVNTLVNGVLLHAMAGDKLAEEVGEYGLKAQDMQRAIGHVLHEL